MQARSDPSPPEKQCDELQVCVLWSTALLVPGWKRLSPGKRDQVCLECEELTISSLSKTGLLETLLPAWLRPVSFTVYMRSCRQPGASCKTNPLRRLRGLC